jgi:hypothetical protein
MTECQRLDKKIPPKSADVMVEQFAEFSAYLYYFMAKKIIEKFGNEGKEAIREAINDFGLFRGKRVREKVIKAGLEPTMENEYLFHDLPIGSKAWVAESRKEGNKHITHVLKCPFGQIWKQLGEEKIGLLYCDIDYSIWKGYQPKIKFRLNKNILKGDPYCEMIYDISEMEKGDEG